MNDYNVITNCRDGVGEGPIWVAAEQAIYWVDITRNRLHRYRLTDDTTQTWPMPEKLCWIVEQSDRREFLIGLESGMAQLSIDPFEIGPITPLEKECLNRRLNDAKVDAQGRLWAGTMEMTGAAPSGSLYRIDRLGCSVKVDGDYYIPNGPAFSPDGNSLYHADSLRRIVYRFTVADDGSLTDKHTHIVFRDEWGLPDGMTVDAQGGLWIGHWDGGRISRFDPDGRLDRAIPLPASRITSCAFGGNNLDRLFVTSACEGREDEPLAGALFEVQTDVQGVAAAMFAG
jgi:xylono-1,5-lactonase